MGMKLLVGPVACAVMLGTACDTQTSRTASTAPAALSAASRPVTAEGQSVCPVSNYDIDPAIVVEHQGQRVYLCCEGCREAFQKYPDRFLSKLPQFGGKEEPSLGKMPH
jgi:hypothetical protein